MVYGTVLMGVLFRLLQCFQCCRERDRTSTVKINWGRLEETGNDVIIH